MTDVTIYHNPRCSKSRQTLALLHENGIEPAVVEYLRETPDEATLKQIVRKLGIQDGLAASAVIRSKEYRALGLPDTDDCDKVIARMAAHPEIIERPIVVKGDQARLGRPPEQVLEIL